MNFSNFNKDRVSKLSLIFFDLTPKIFNAESMEESTLERCRVAKS